MAVEFRLRPGFVFVTGLLCLLGFVLHGYAPIDWPGGPVGYSALFVVGSLALIAVHEYGHAWVGQLHGLRLTRVLVGAKFSVTMEGDHTPQSMFHTAVAGPVVGATAAFTVLVASAPFPWLTPLAVAAVVALIDNVANVALFFVPGSDGNRMVTALRAPAERPTA